ncbi:MAG: 3-deoxy-manno-octulosonate cytidylyltransferase, partial [Gammaproteobacteria bacterium]
MSFWVIIPARYNATRLPGKPLRSLAGRPLIQHVHERALESGAGRVVIATDDARIQKAAQGFGAEVCMTSPSCQSGTERLAEAVERLACPPDAVVVNLQGDEPLIPPVLLDQVAALLAEDPAADMATLYVPIEDPAELADPHAVKVVADRKGYALYFSRAPIPHGGKAFRHIGLYAYRAGFL